MTRFLSESLQAPEPFFRIGLRRLESANGHPNADIRLSAEVVQAAKAKMRELGLDPATATASELYRALQTKVALDDAQLAKTLRTRAATHVNAEADLVSGMIHALKELPASKHCYALKSSQLKTLIKQLPPKKTMKRLGYRSLDSMLKHEPPLLILSAAWLVEGEAWQKHLLEQYKKLRPSDFEERAIQIIQADGSKRWRELAAEIVDQSRHNLLCFKEMGALVLLPLPTKLQPGVATAGFSLALHELNEIRAASSLLKLARVRSDFGRVVQTVASDESRFDSQFLDQSVPWNLIQRYYSRLSHLFREDLFEPHLERADMVWQPIEDSLATIEPSFAFWRSTAHLGLLHDRQLVSLNLIDTALNYCNHLPFEQRVAHYFQRSLWHELLLNYLNRESVEQTVLAQLQPELAEA